MADDNVISLGIDPKDIKSLEDAERSLRAIASAAGLTETELTDLSKSVLSIVKNLNSITVAKSPFSAMAASAKELEGHLKQANTQLALTAKLNATLLADSKKVGSITATKSTILLQQKLNSEIEKQAALKAKLRETSGVTQDDINLRKAKEYTQELEKQAILDGRKRGSEARKIVKDIESKKTPEGFSADLKKRLDAEAKASDSRIKALIAEKKMQKEINDLREQGIRAGKEARGKAEQAGKDLRATQTRKRINLLLEEKSVEKGMVDMRAKAARAGRDLRVDNSRIEKTTKATKGLTEAQKIQHGVVRGLAGGMGKLWLAYGQGIAAITAMGAAYALMYTAQRTVAKGFEVGSEFEYLTKYTDVLNEQSGKATVALSEVREELLSVTGVVQPVNELAGGMKEMAKAGIDTATALDTLDEAAQLAHIGDIGIEESTKLIVRAKNAYAETGITYAETANVIAKATFSSAASLEEFATALSYTAPLGKVVGLSLEQVSAAIAALHDASIAGSKAGTSLTTGLLKLYAPSTKVKELFEELNIEFNAFSDSGAPKDIGEMMGDLAKAMKSLPKEDFIRVAKEAFGLRALKGGGVLLREFIDAMETGSGKYQDLVKDLVNVREESTFLAEVMEDLGDTSKVAMLEMQKAFKDALAGAFLENSDELVTFLNELTSTLSSPEFKQAVSDLGKLAGYLAKISVDILVGINEWVNPVKATTDASGAIKTFIDSLLAEAKGFDYVADATKSATENQAAYNVEMYKFLEAKSKAKGIDSGKVEPEGFSDEVPFMLEGGKGVKNLAAATKKVIMEVSEEAKRASTSMDDIIAGVKTYTMETKTAADTTLSLIQELAKSDKVLYKPSGEPTKVLEEVHAAMADISYKGIYAGLDEWQKKVITVNTEVAKLAEAWKVSIHHQKIKDIKSAMIQNLIHEGIRKVQEATDDLNFSSMIKSLKESDSEVKQLEGSFKELKNQAETFLEGQGVAFDSTEGQDYFKALVAESRIFEDALKDINGKLRSMKEEMEDTKFDFARDLQEETNKLPKTITIKAALDMGMSKAEISELLDSSNRVSIRGDSTKGKFVQDKAAIKELITLGASAGEAGVEGRERQLELLKKAYAIAKAMDTSADEDDLEDKMNRAKASMEKYSKSMSSARLNSKNEYFAAKDAYDKAKRGEGVDEGLQAAKMTSMKELQKLITDAQSEKMRGLEEEKAGIKELQASTGKSWTTMQDAVKGYGAMIDLATGKIYKHKAAINEVFSGSVSDVKKAGELFDISGEKIETPEIDTAKQEEAGTAMKAMWEQSVDGVRLYNDALVANADTLKDLLIATASSIGMLADMWTSLITYVDLYSAAIKRIPEAKVPAPGNIPGKALGGDVSAGSPYMIGERGKELFIPDVSGTIVPNNKLESHAKQGNKSVDINLNFNGENIQLQGTQPNVDAFVSGLEKLKRRAA